MSGHISGLTTRLLSIVEGAIFIYLFIYLVYFISSNIMITPKDYFIMQYFEVLAALISCIKQGLINNL